MRKHDPKNKRRNPEELDINDESALLEKIQYLRENSPEQNGEDF